MIRDPKRQITGIPDGPKTLVYQQLVNRLTSDSTLSALINRNGWFLWEGKPSDVMEVALPMMPAIRITPAARAPEWSDPVGQRGMLTFDIELWSKGTCCDDIANLWDVVERAIYTSSDIASSHAFEALLRAAGAITGQVSVLMCAMMPWSPDKQENPMILGMYARGQLGVDVRIIS